MKDVITKGPQTLGEVDKIAQEHISVQVACWASYPRSDKKKEQRKKGNGKNGKGKSGKDFDKKKEKTRGKGNNFMKKKDEDYTPFNKSRMSILKEIKGKPLFGRLEKLTIPVEKSNRSKNCKYHENHGHDTKNCWALKNFLKEQVKKRNLN